MLYSSITPGIIETESGPVSVQDLSTFLYYFRAAYVESLRCKDELQIQDNLADLEIDGFTSEVAQRMAVKGYNGISENAKATLNVEDDLYLTDISRRNPIDVVFSCVGVALVAAVIISGGEVKWDKDGFRVKLPPLGKGIAELKKAINGSYRPRAQDRKKTDDSTPSP